MSDPCWGCNMTSLMYIYTLLIIVLYIINSMGFFLLYRDRQVKAYLWVSIIFVYFTMDVAILLAMDLFPAFNAFFIQKDRGGWLYMLFYTFMGQLYRIFLGYVFDKPVNKIEWSIFVLYLLVVISCDLQEMSTFLNTLPRAFVSIYAIVIYIRAIIWLKEQKLDWPEWNYEFLNSFLILSILFFTLGHALRWLNFFQSSNYFYRNLLSELLGICYIVYGLVYLIHCFSLRKQVEDRKLTIHQELEKEAVYGQLRKEYNLTNREAEITVMITDGLSNQEIADTLVISYGTVKTHIYNIFKKLSVTSRGQIAPLLQSTFHDQSHQQNRPAQ